MTRMTSLNDLDAPLLTFSMIHCESEHSIYGRNVRSMLHQIEVAIGRGSDDCWIRQEVSGTTGEQRELIRSFDDLETRLLSKGWIVAREKRSSYGSDVLLHIRLLYPNNKQKPDLNEDTIP